MYGIYNVFDHTWTYLIIATDEWYIHNIFHGTKLRFSDKSIRYDYEILQIYK